MRVLAHTLLTPAVLLGLVVVAFPFAFTIVLSFLAGHGMNIDLLFAHAADVSNYARVLSDPATWHSLLVSVLYVVIATAPAFLIGLGTALLLNGRLPGRRVFRTLLLMPWPVPGIVAAIVFLWMFDGSYGVINYLLRLVHAPFAGQAWFFNPATALIAVSIPTIWKAYPFFTLMFLAALQTIPADLYEAARVDGAGAFARFRNVTWPSLRGPAVLGLVLNGMWVFREFDFIYPTTAGGPSGATETIAIRIYTQAFSFFQLGTASTLGVVALALTAIVVYAVYPFLRRTYLD